MAALVLRNYGGMAPAAVGTANNPSIANLVRNLDLRHSDFRPFRQSAPIGPTMTPGQTLYRFEKTGYWITRTTAVNFVRGPIPNDLTERTYYTGDGAPKVTDDTGAVRTLGVPAPGAAPAVTVNATAQYSTDDAQADQSKKLAEVMKAIRDNYAWQWTGLTPEELASRFVAAPAPSLWSYRFRVPGTLAGGVFTPVNASHQNLIDDRLYWSMEDLGGGNFVGQVDLDLRSEHIVLNADAMEAALAAVTDPSDSTGVKKLMRPDQIDVLMETLTDQLRPAQQARDAAISRLRDAKNQFVILADSGSTTVAGNVGAVKAFYAKPYTVATIDAAVIQAATAIINAMHTFAFTSYTDPGEGGSGGGYDGPRNPDEYQNPM